MSRAQRRRMASRRREQSQRAIGKAAWEPSSQFGAEKVTVADMAREPRVSPATISGNFDSKGALVREFVTSVIDEPIGRVEEVLASDKLYRDKMAGFVEFVSETVAHEGPSAVDDAVFTSSFDLQNDPEIRKIRDSVREKMTNLLLGLVQEGREQGQVSLNLSDEACRVYFGAFVAVFTDPHLQHRFSTDPKLVRDLGSLMTYGLGGQHT